VINGRHDWTSLHAVHRTVASHRDDNDLVCAACMSVDPFPLPKMPLGFWQHETMLAAYAARNIGLVIRAYRMHPDRGRPLPQPVVAEALGISQPQLSRIETRGQIRFIDTLVFYAQVLRIPGEFLWFDYPDDPSYAESTTARDVESTAFGVISEQRTRFIVDAVGLQRAPALIYCPPQTALLKLEEFINSEARVCVVEGPPGCGKSELTYEIARRFGERLVVQLHSMDNWPGRRADLAEEILRYASVDTQRDPVVAMERGLAPLDHGCLVIVDGLKAFEDVTHVGQEVDRLLRQITDRRMRFLLMVRTPPRCDLSAFPVLAALSYRPDHRAGHTQPISLAEWSLGEARQVWNASRTDGEPGFADLPVQLQQLARLPIYMKLLKSSGHDIPSGRLDSYWLVDACVRALARAAGADEALTIDRLAEQALSDLNDVVPAALLETRRTTALSSDLPMPPGGPLLDTSGAGAVMFGHDIIREYAAASAIAAAVAERGRTTSTVAGINQLAAQSRSSAAARGLLAFVISALDGTAPEILRSLALAPTLSAAHALPLMLTLADRASTLLTPEVLRRCAARCNDTEVPLELACALLRLPQLIPALDGDYGAWAVDALDRFGPELWTDLAQALEHHADAVAVNGFVQHVDLTRPEHAVFIARFAHLFTGLNDTTRQASIAALVGHPDWRVRAALAGGLIGDRGTPGTEEYKIVDQLVQDDDYKVRAAVARLIVQLDPAESSIALRSLLTDPNWHVRACALDAVLGDAGGTPSPALREHVIKAITTDVTWNQCPPHLDRLRHRLLLLYGATPDAIRPAVRDQALFVLLREAHTGWLSLPEEQLGVLHKQARESSWWLLKRERDLRAHRGPLQAPSARQGFRQLRDGSSVQVALDLRDLDLAVRVARAANTAGADLIEVGDPLIKEYGLLALSEVKRQIPDAVVVAEMMSADWGREQVVLAAEAGADAVLLIGPATASSVSAAVAAGARLGVPILLDVAVSQLNEMWIHEMERLGIDGFTVTTNIDLGVRGRHPLDNARAIRGWSRLPVAVSGGFSPTDHGIIASPDWDILIIGRSVAEAIDPAIAAREITELVGRRRQGSRHAHRRVE
jgi:3-keto-L-gulonate-6-phosphate decarboxylase/transcriptional regulator with XRE-family HTH domain